jgi:hypothetical protein
MSAMTMLYQEDIRSPRMAFVTRRAVVWVCALAIATVATVTTVIVLRAATAQQAVITVAANLQQGQRITAADLRVAKVGSGTVAGALPVTAVSGLVGQYAITQLTSGSVLTQADVSAQPIPVPAMARVSVRVKASRLVPGDKVTVTAGGRTTSAVVFAVSGQTVELLVPTDYASGRITVLP